jgi:hypothetical protein
VWFFCPDALEGLRGGCLDGVPILKWTFGRLNGMKSHGIMNIWTGANT